MYSNCLFCQTPFGENRELEYLPVGRRVAFDPAKGRLWVVCRACARWNLVPYEDRVETIEACELRFRRTVVRVSTDNVGLCRIPEGLELVRIGRPLRPEFAAWRYGQQFQRRHQRRAIGSLGKVVSVPGMLLLAPLLAAIGGPISPILLAGLAIGGGYHLLRRSALKVKTTAGRTLELSSGHIQNARLIRDDTVSDGWALMVSHLRRGRKQDLEWEVLHGHDARLAASLLLPKVNPLGGNEETVGGAVRWLEAAGGPEDAFATFARSHIVRMPLDNVESKIVTLHAEVRLALEMALHEEEERRALAGELSVLEWVWRHEEMLADLADGLAVAQGLDEQLDGLRRRHSRAGLVRSG